MAHRKLRHWFVPSAHNEYHPHALRAESLVVVAVLMVGAQLLFNLILTGRPSVLGFGSDIQPEKIIEITNAERRAAGLAPLTVDPSLAAAAQRKAQDMLTHDYWAHTSPSGQAPWAFVKEAGYHYRFAGENLAKDFNTSRGVVAGWLASATHRDNLLGSNYQDIGVAVVNGQLGGKETTLVVALYGAPSISLANRTFQGIVPTAQADSGTVAAAEVTYNLFRPLPFFQMMTWSQLLIALLLAIFAGLYLNDHRLKIRFSMPRRHHSHSVLQAAVLLAALGLLIANSLYGVVG